MGHGHSLLELMIALALGVLVTVSACALYRPARAAWTAAADRATLNEAGRAALALIALQARLAGLAVQADGGGPSRAQWLAQQQPVFTCEAGRPEGPADAPYCVDQAPPPGSASDNGTSDGVQFVSLASTLASWPDSKGAPTDCLGQALAAGAANIARFFAHVGSGGLDDAELYCDGGGRLGDAQPVVAGIETLRLRYALAGGDTPQRSVDAGSLDQLRALLICVVARGQNTHHPYPYTDCDGRAQAGADGYRRLTYRQWVALRNLDTRS